MLVLLFSGWLTSLLTNEEMSMFKLHLKDKRIITSSLNTYEYACQEFNAGRGVEVGGPEDSYPHNGYPRRLISADLIAEIEMVERPGRG